MRSFAPFCRRKPRACSRSGCSRRAASSCYRSHPRRLPPLAMGKDQESGGSFSGKENAKIAHASSLKIRRERVSVALTSFNLIVRAWGWATHQIRHRRRRRYRRPWAGALGSPQRGSVGRHSAPCAAPCAQARRCPSSTARRPRRASIRSRPRAAPIAPSIRREEENDEI